MAGGERLAPQPGLTAGPRAGSIGAMEAINPRPWHRRLLDIRSPWIWLVYLPIFGIGWLNITVHYANDSVSECRPFTHFLDADSCFLTATDYQSWNEVDMTPASKRLR